MIIASKLRLAVRAVRLKLRLLNAYDTFWPAALRGGKLLLRGRVGEFTRKLFNGRPTPATRRTPRAKDRPYFWRATSSASAATTTSS